MKKTLFTAFILLIFGQWVQAQDYVWIIGGGPSLTRSQGQIELNTQWVQTILQQQRPDAKVKIYYTDGNHPNSDVQIWQQPTESLTDLQPLARVFDFQRENGERYRNHRIAPVVAGTEPVKLLNDMKKDFAQLKKDDRVLLIYQGHGSDNEEQDIAKNTFDLWGKNGKQRLTAKKFAHVLDKVPTTVPVRFVFPQCYSGGFARLIHPEAEDRLDLVAGQRCGFMAESAYEESEGCSSSINVGDYRDYTTYFFAALNHRTRLNQALSQNPDRNKDGVVSLNEAHYYSLSQAESTDLPRSTSEVYLEQWQPWYLRWLNPDKIPQNIYATLADEVTQRYHFTTTGKALSQALNQRRNDWVESHEKLIEKRQTLRQKTLNLEDKMREIVWHKWPNTMYPYTKNFYDFLINDLTEAQNFIVAQADYAKLVKLQDQDLVLERQLLNFERKITQIDKILRLRKLAQILDQFNRYANQQQQADYQRLFQCENSTL